MVVVGGLVSVIIAIRLFDLQVRQHEALSQKARNEINDQIVLQPDRGIITDYQGNILAMDVERQSLFVNPQQIDPERAPRLALALASFTGSDTDYILRVITNTERRWARMVRWLEPSVSQQIEALDEPGLYLVYEPRRVYPQKTFAASVIGAVNHEGAGISGVEAFYNNELKGMTGTLRAEFDGSTRRSAIAIAPQQTRPPRHGKNLRLTIDPPVQHIAETELRAAVEKHNADGGTIIIMEPDSGAIRAMANWPPFDPNNYGDYPPEVYGRNPAIGSLYEPGSTFKIIVAAIGLQARAFTADTVVDDPGIITRRDMQIHNWNYQGNGAITPAEMLYHSSNVGAVKFNELIGPETFYEFVETFGFGHPTGIELIGEESGIVHPPSSPFYNEAIFLTNSYGQGIAMTPLQLVRAVGAVANDGLLMHPYLVEDVCEQDQASEETADLVPGENTTEHKQQCETTRPGPGVQVVEPGVAWTVRRMLVNSANHYAHIVWLPITGSIADQWLVPGYAVGAKTGTASIPMEGGGYDPSYVIGSVIGFAPAENSRYVILVKIDRPKGDAWGLASAVPAFTRIVDQLMNYQRIEPDPALFSPGQEGNQ